MHTNERSAGLRSVAPVFSTTDVGRWLEHYRSLGFEVEAHDDESGFASLDSIDIHVSCNPDHDPLTTAGCAYLHVEDADDLYRRWSTASGGRDVEPIYTDYGIREGAHLDPDNKPPSLRLSLVVSRLVRCSDVRPRDRSSYGDARGRVGV